jgi:hypothetical protein
MTRSSYIVANRRPPQSPSDAGKTQQATEVVERKQAAEADTARKTQQATEVVERKQEAEADTALKNMRLASALSALKERAFQLQSMRRRINLAWSPAMSKWMGYVEKKKRLVRAADKVLLRLKHRCLATAWAHTLTCARCRSPALLERERERVRARERGREGGRERGYRFRVALSAAADESNSPIRVVSDDDDDLLSPRLTLTMIYHGKRFYVDIPGRG